MIKAVFLVTLLATALPAQAGLIVVSSISGADPAAIQAGVDAYRTSLGTLNPNVAGSFGTGRREINWDGVPDMFSSPNNLPANFFNVNSPRGVVFSTPGTGFQVSATAAVGNIEFNNINPTYSSSFQTFSPQRLFDPIGSNVTDVNFFVPGSTTPAFVRSFGAIFTDVDLTGAPPACTSIQAFNGATSLGTFCAPVANNGLSFLALFATPNDIITRVRIVTGNAALGPNDGGAVDVVAMDDFIYNEPVSLAAIPEPGSVILFLSGAAGLLLWSRRRVG